jgi:transposase
LSLPFRFGPRLYAVVIYMKTFQALSYEGLQAALSDLFGLTLSQGGLMNLLRRAQGRFADRQEHRLGLEDRSSRLQDFGRA